MISDKQLFDYLRAAAQEIHKGHVGLGYHNLDHVTHCVLTHDRLYGAERENNLNGMAEKLALYFHDSVYVPSAVGSDNEQMSAKLFVWHVRRFVDPLEYEPTWTEFLDNRRGTFQADNPANLLEAVMYVPMWIQATTIVHHLQRQVEGASITAIDRILDCDLASMGKAYPAFKAQQIALIKERNPFLELSDELVADDAAAHLEFLGAFLNKPYIYRTPEARAVFEEQAVANIEQWIRDVNKGELTPL